MRRLTLFTLILMIIIMPNLALPATATHDCTAEAITEATTRIFSDYEAALVTEDAPEAALQALIDDLTALERDCTRPLIPTLSQDAARALVADLRAGGYVIYVRHTETDRSQSDTDLTRCDGQRNLTQQGREDALMIRDAYQNMAIPVSRIITTEYCRVRETAALAFGVADIIPRAALTATLPDLLGTAPPDGTNTIIVAHIGTLNSTVGLADLFDEGDAFVYRPSGDGEFEYVARIGLEDWRVLGDVGAE